MLWLYSCRPTRARRIHRRDPAAEADAGLRSVSTLARRAAVQRVGDRPRIRMPTPARLGRCADRPVGGILRSSQAVTLAPTLPALVGAPQRRRREPVDRQGHGVWPGAARTRPPLDPRRDHLAVLGAVKDRFRRPLRGASRPGQRLRAASRGLGIGFKGPTKRRADATSSFRRGSAHEKGCSRWR